MGRLRAAAIALALLPLCAAPALGAPRAEGAFDEDEPRLAATLLVHPDDDPAGQRVRVGVWFEPDPGWHLYWRNPGETGLPTRIEFQVEGGRAGPLAWPAPRAFREAEGELTTYGYDEPVLLAAELGFDAPAAGPRRLRARADVLVCETQCIPATLELERALAPPTPDEAPALRARFAAAAAALPEPPGRLGVDLEARAAGPEAGIAARLGVFPCRSAADAQACAVLTPDTEAIFFPDLLDGQALAPLGVERDPDHPDGFWVALAGEPGTEAPTRVRGVLALRGLDGERRTVEVDLPLAPAQPASVASAVSLWTALLLAFVGGLLLNLMPCVLPVLAIKVVGLAELAHRPRREALGLAGAYAAGVLATMGALAAIVVGLRAAGHAVGWGFQFQEPLFVHAVCTVLVVFALNLLGAFEIGLDTGRLADVGQQGSGLRRSFFEGLLAVVLATPCSAPFLGTAVGVAFASSAERIVAVFASIGLGLAAPYLALAAVPAWRNLLPRPGRWMLHLRAGLGFLLLASCVWLLWVLGRSAGADALAVGLAWLWAVAFACWVYGRLQQAAAGRRPLAVAVLLAALAVVGANAVSVQRTAPEPRYESVPFALERLDRELAAGQTVFLLFTADWCLTCKLNERTVLRDERVLAALSHETVVVLEADWTRRDESIRAALARYGRSGVPAYVVHHADAPDRPRVLSELPSVEEVLSALGSTAAR